MKQPTQEENLLLQAMKFAKDKHAGQIDDAGAPYFKHVAQVAKTLAFHTEDEAVIAAGFLHDTLENTDTTYAEIHEAFGERVADLVLEVTKDGDAFPNLDTRDGMLIKFADRLSNLSRMETWTDKRKLNYMNKSKFWKSAP